MQQQSSIGNLRIMERCGKINSLHKASLLPLNGHMSAKFGVELGNLLKASGQKQADLRRKIGIDRATLSRLISGETESTDWLAKIVDAFAPDIAAQSKLVAAYLFDHIPSELSSCVEVRYRVSAGRTEIFEPPLDEFEAALQEIARFADEPAIRVPVLAVRSIIPVVLEARKQRA
jgi:transcriptional regulator with XRE-family HTH domain